MGSVVLIERLHEFQALAGFVKQLSVSLTQCLVRQLRSGAPTSPDSVTA